MSEEKERVKEEVRLIRWRMAHENFRFSAEFRIIPRWLKQLSIVLFIIGQMLALGAYFYGSTANPLPFMGIAAAVTIVVDLLLLFFGYVNRDAKRRGMNSTLWTLLAIFLPYGIGLIVYFLMREPLPYECPSCGAMVNARFNFCPTCKHDLRPCCPQCRREVRAEDKYCPFCAQELGTTQSRPPVEQVGPTTVPPGS